MEFLRDDYLMALNDLVNACRVSADFLDSAAEACGDEALAEHLQALARDRNDAGDAFSAVMRRLDDFPNTPPAEREWIEEAVTRLIAHFTPDHAAPLLSHCRDKEAEVADAARLARNHERDPELQRRLDTLAAEAETRVPDLARAYGHRLE